MNVGFIGLGIMGQPMAQNLVKAGHLLTVYNRTASRCDPLQAVGAKVATTPKAVAQATEVIITIVSDTPDVEAVLFGADGVIEGIGAGKVVVDMSTISPAETESFAARLGERGALMLDAPVSGGDKGAIAGALSIMVGGSEEAFAKAKPLFDAMGKNIVHVGGNGDGQRTKACNQIAGALHVVAMSEALNLARAAGLDGEKVLAAISQGAAGSWMLSNLAPRALKNDFDPGFMIKLQAKDLRLAAEEIERLGIGAEGTLLAKALFDRATEMGMGELGTQGLYKLYTEQGV